MDQTSLRTALYNKYIAPTKETRPSYIGIEIELPLVNLAKAPVDFDIVQKVTKEFLQEFSFTHESIDDDGRIYAAEQPTTGDILSYDCSYNNLELSMGKEQSLIVLQQCFASYYDFLQRKYRAYDHQLTGMGINPYRNLNHNVPIASERYRMLFHHLASYPKYAGTRKYFHSYPTYGSFASASQVQLDVSNEDLIQTLHAFTLLEPIKSLLFANSMMLGDEDDLLIARDMLWEDSTHGINPHNVGLFEEVPSSEEELLDYLESYSLYCVMRDGRYINFEPIPLGEYFKRPLITGEVYENGNYQEVNFTPEDSDLEYLRTFKFEDLTYRGTIEFRSCCCQPVHDAMTIAAFHVGLQGRLKELDQLLTDDHVIYHHGYSVSELRTLFNGNKIPPSINPDDLYKLCKQVLDLAAEGLKDRNLDEEQYLEPLYERVAKRSNPSLHLLHHVADGGTIEDIITEYGKL